MSLQNSQFCVRKVPEVSDVNSPEDSASLQHLLTELFLIIPNIFLPKTKNYDLFILHF